MGNAKSRHQLKRSRSWRGNVNSIDEGGPRDVTKDFCSHCDDEQYKQRLRSRNHSTEELDESVKDTNEGFGVDAKARIAAVAAKTSSRLRKLSNRSSGRSGRSSMSSGSSGTSSTTSSFDAGHPSRPGSSSVMATLVAAATASHIPEEEPEMTVHQLTLIQLAWHAVISDSANLCLNFFMDINRMFPKRKNSGSSGHGVSNASPGRRLIDRISVAAATASASNKAQSSELSYNALKFTCAVDAAVRSMTEDFKGNVNAKTKELLQEIGMELYTFFGIDSLSHDQKSKMTMSFIEFLRLAALHARNRNARTATDIVVEEWTEEMTEAWKAFFYKLLYHLENDDDLDM